MRLVESLPQEWNKKHTYKYSVAMFECPLCKAVVKRGIMAGKIAKSCGCLKKSVKKTNGLIFVKRTESRPRNDGRLDGYGLFQCPACGNKIERIISEGKKMKTCGCVHPRAMLKHGQHSSRLYHIWNGMKQRCSNANASSYERYGGRGINVVQEWQDDFINFREWAFCNGYNDNLQIDRIDNDKGYHPDNCRWVSVAENSRNRSTTKLDKKAVSKIKKLFKDGVPCGEIAPLFSISQNYISDVVRGARWAAK